MKKLLFFNLLLLSTTYSIHCGLQTFGRSLRTGSRVIPSAMRAGRASGIRSQKALTWQSLLKDFSAKNFKSRMEQNQLNGLGNSQRTHFTIGNPFDRFLASYSDNYNQIKKEETEKAKTAALALYLENLNDLEYNFKKGLEESKQTLYENLEENKNAISKSKIEQEYNAANSAREQAYEDYEKLDTEWLKSYELFLETRESAQKDFNAGRISQRQYNQINEDAYNNLTTKEVELAGPRSKARNKLKDMETLTEELYSAKKSLEKNKTKQDYQSTISKIEQEYSAANSSEEQAYKDYQKSYAEWRNGYDLFVEAKQSAEKDLAESRISQKQYNQINEDIHENWTTKEVELKGRLNEAQRNLDYIRFLIEELRLTKNSLEKNKAKQDHQSTIIEQIVQNLVSKSANSATDEAYDQFIQAEQSGKEDFAKGKTSQQEYNEIDDDFYPDLSHKKVTLSEELDAAKELETLESSNHWDANDTKALQDFRKEISELLKSKQKEKDRLEKTRFEGVLEKAETVAFQNYLKQEEDLRAAQEEKAQKAAQKKKR